MRKIFLYSILVIFCGLLLVCACPTTRAIDKEVGFSLPPKASVVETESLTPPIVSHSENTKSIKSDGVVVGNSYVMASKSTKKAEKSKSVLQSPAVPPTTTPLNVNHPEHFYEAVWCQVSITIGKALPTMPGDLSIEDQVPSAKAYSITLRGEPADQFEIKQGEQIISAPTKGIKSSTVYFDVRPLTRGKKKLIYQVKARESLTDPGIGLPEVQRDIIVEVNKQTVGVWVKGIGIWILTGIGTALTALVGILIKKKFDKYN